MSTIGGPADLEGAGAETLTRVHGFVDLQVNGGFGHDFSSNPASIWEVAALLPRTGVTAFVPTIITSPVETALAAQEILRRGPPAGWVGATPLGLHLEGPMISTHKRGTHPAELVTSLSSEIVDRLIAAGPPLMVTVAPELEGAEQVIRSFAAAGTVVSMGHSDATAAQAAAAVDWGASHVTHLFNAMSGLDHRRPGLAATALIDPRVTTGLIADGVHVASEMLQLALRLKGPDGISLVTDAMSAMGSEDGTHQIGNVEVTVEGMEAHNVEGALAGGVATMDHVVRTMIASTGCSLAEASAMASTTPLRVVGQVAEENDTVTLDAELRVVATEISGRLVYERRPS